MADLWDLDLEPASGTSQIRCRYLRVEEAITDADGDLYHHLISLFFCRQAERRAKKEPSYEPDISTADHSHGRR